MASAAFVDTAAARQGGVQVGGNATNTTLVGNNTNAAIGVASRSCSEIGNTDDSDAC